MQWLELLSAGVSAVAAGAEVFAKRAATIAERLDGELKRAMDSDDKRSRLRDMAKGDE